MQSLFICSDALFHDTLYYHYLLRHLKEAYGPITSIQFHPENARDKRPNIPPNTLIISAPHCAEAFNTHPNLLIVDTQKPLTPLLKKPQPAQSTLHCLGIDADLLKDLLNDFKSDARLTIYPHLGGWSVIHMHAPNETHLIDAFSALTQYLPKTPLIGEDIMHHLVITLKERKERISFAESCTGGQLSALLTSVSGASEVFEGSFITYSNDIKEAWLNVTHQDLIDYGAVSAAVVESMAEGCKNRTFSTYGIGISGIAGPNGGTKEKPVGTVFIGVSGPKGTFSERLQLFGDRQIIQQTALYNALRLLLNTHPELC